MREAREDDTEEDGEAHEAEHVRAGRERNSMLRARESPCERHKRQIVRPIRERHLDLQQVEYNIIRHVLEVYYYHFK